MPLAQQHRQEKQRPRASTPLLRQQGLEVSSQLRAASQSLTPVPRLVDLLSERNGRLRASVLTPSAQASHSSKRRTRLDAGSQQKHLERMARPARQNADGYRADERGQVLPVLHRDEERILKPNTPAMGHGQIADCVDRLYRQSQLHQRGREQALHAKYLDPPVAALLLTPGVTDGGRPRSPTGVFTKLTAEGQEGMVGRLYTRQVQAKLDRTERARDALRDLESAKTRYKRLPPPTRDFVERMFQGPVAHKAAESAKLQAKYAPPPK